MSNQPQPLITPEVASRREHVLGLLRDAVRLSSEMNTLRDFGPYDQVRDKRIEHASICSQLGVWAPELLAMLEPVPPIPQPKPRRFLVEIVPQKDAEHGTGSLQGDGFYFRALDGHCMSVREIHPLDIVMAISLLWGIDTPYEALSPNGKRNVQAFIALLREAGMEVEPSE